MKLNYQKIIGHENKVLIAVVAVLLVIVLGVSYSLFSQVTSSDNNQVITTGTLQVEYSSDNGYIKDDKNEGILPQANSSALSEDGYDFTVKNTGSYSVTYQVYLYINEEDYNADLAAGKVDGELFTSLQYLKYNLKTNSNNDNEIKFLKDQYSFEEDGITKYLIYQGLIEGSNKIDSHALRVWLDEDVTTAEIGKYIYLKLEVASYITGQEPTHE